MQNRAPVLAATWRELTCVSALRCPQCGRRDVEHLRRAWVSPEYQISLRRARAPRLSEDGSGMEVISPAMERMSATQNGALWSAETRRQLLCLVGFGDLAAAAALLERQLDALRADETAADASCRMLQTELELLQSGLALAIRRGQLNCFSLGSGAARALMYLVANLARGGRDPHQDRRDQPAPQSRAGLGSDDALIDLLWAELALLRQALIWQQRGWRPQHRPLDRAQSLAAVAASQLGQDLWVLERTGYKTGGFFVEFGATDGVLLSNTWLLEQHFGWRGLCAEPNPRFYRQLQSNRTCRVSDACIGARSGIEVAFILSDAYGGIAAYAHDDQHGAKREAYRAAGHVVTLETLSLNDFLNQHQAPREIDYISIDTEGSEYEILSTFPFDHWQVRLFSIEHNFGEQRKHIRRLMERNGYVCTEAQWDDWYERQAD